MTLQNVQIEKLYKPRKKFFIVINDDGFFLSHFLAIGQRALKNNYAVSVFAIDSGRRKEIESLGFDFIPLPTSRDSLNPFKEFKVLLLLFKCYRKYKPDIIQHFTIKPVLYGSLVTKVLKLNCVVNYFTGMGYLFSNANKYNKLTHQIMLKLFKFIFSKPDLLFIFENKDDLNLVSSAATIKKEQCFIVNGAGVDLGSYVFSSEQKIAKLRVLLPARMLWDKGVAEFVQAAQILYTKYNKTVEFILAGKVDLGNKACISETQLKKWNQQGFVKWIGFQNNMVQTLKESHIIVLPSYREGLPKALIEACAVGRPIVTTDVPGCRETVENGLNGFLVPVKTVEPLARAIEKLILDEQLRVQMGLAGRRIAEQKFALNKVVTQVFDIYEGEFSMMNDEFNGT